MALPLSMIDRLRSYGVPDEDIEVLNDGWNKPVPNVTKRHSDSAGAARTKRWRERHKPSQAVTVTRHTGETIEGEVLSFEKEKKERKISRTPVTPVTSRFPDFKSLFPRRKGNYGWPKAEKKFNHLVSKGVPPDEIIEGVRRYATLQTELGKVGTEFIQMPTTWLNGEMWKDDTAAEASFEERYERARLAFRNGTPL